MSGFAALGLRRELVQAAAALGYAGATPVQAAAIPAVLAGRDLLATAATGSGKTAGYGLPLLQQLAERIGRSGRSLPRRCGLLVLVPTRELALQVGQSLRTWERSLPAPLKLCVLHGGVSINPQLMELRGGADGVVATPGRLLDVVAHNGLDLSGVAALVLDEADRLLDAGFADELARVLALLPAQRQNLLLSATLPPAVQALAGQLLADPLVLQDAAANAGLAQLPPGQLTQRVIEVDAARRTPLLRHLIAQEGWPRVLVFVATRYACAHVADKLRRSGLAAQAFHGDASAGARREVLAEFHASRLQVLVATDLGARGLDIAQLPVVVNFDLPRSAVDYVHRVGRTARAGASGLAVSFVSAGTEGHMRLIEKRQGHRVPRERIRGFEPAPSADAAAGPSAGGAAGQATAPASTGGIKGRRPSKKDKLRAAAARAESVNFDG